jgi:hypothetical protein
MKSRQKAEQQSCCYFFCWPFVLLVDLSDFGSQFTTVAEKLDRVRHYEPEQAPSAVRAMGLNVCHQVWVTADSFSILHNFLCIFLFRCIYTHLHASLLRPGCDGCPWPLAFLVVLYHRISRQGGAFWGSVLERSHIYRLAPCTELPFLHCFLIPYVSDSRTSLASFTLPITQDYATALWHG